MEKITGNTISTGKAARLCSVTRDTILKWVKKGILEAVRTPGGHYRVLEESVKPYLAAPVPAEKAQGPVDSDSTVKPWTPCWEYMSPDGAPSTSCQDCLVYRAKALRCFEVAPFGDNGGFRGTFCKTSCQECRYFHEVQGQQNINNILVITEDVYLIASLTSGLHRTSFFLRFTSSTYETSTLIDSFKPGIILVDFDLHQVQMENLCQRIVEDPRLPGTKVIAVAPSRMEPESLNLCSHAVCASLEKPVSLKDLASCIKALEDKIDL